MRKIKFIWLSLFVSGGCLFNISLAWTQTVDNPNVLDQTHGFVEVANNNQAFNMLDDIPEIIKNDINSVQSLMRLETMQALSNVESKLPLKNKFNHEQQTTSFKSHVSSDNDFSTQPYIKSIYGVGNKLKAKVNYKQRDYIYRKGQQYPVGIKPNINNVLLMTDFTDLCVTLVGGTNKYDLCLNN